VRHLAYMGEKGKAHKIETGKVKGEGLFIF
jgi:hypothetical protein